MNKTKPILTKTEIVSIVLVVRSVVCLARKYTAFVSEIEADVYHYGHHTCKAKSQPTFRPSSMVNKAITIDMSLTPSQFQGNAIISALRGRKSWNEIDERIRQSSRNF